MWGEEKRKGLDRVDMLILWWYSRHERTYMEHVLRELQEFVNSQSNKLIYPKVPRNKFWRRVKRLEREYGLIAKNNKNKSPSYLTPKGKKLLKRIGSDPALWPDEVTNVQRLAR